MIAIAVVASLVAYAWIMGYIGGTTTKSGNAIQIQNESFTQAGNLIIYVQNTGQGTVHLKQDSSVYVNDVLQNILNADDKSVASGALIPINVGQTVKIEVNCPYHAGDRIKVVTVEGTFMQTTGTSSSGSGPSGSSNPPTASFTLNPAAPNVGDSVTFTDTSTAGSGTINKWSWSFGDGGTSTVQNPTHSYSTPVLITISLTVTDTNGKTSTSSLTLTVSNYASPTASFTFAPTAPNVGSTVTFTDTSTAGSGTINRWSWSFGDGGTSTAHNPTHSYSSSGQQTVSLTITDSNGKTSSTTRTVNVAYTAPTAEFTISNSNPNVGQTVSFTDTSVPGSTGTITQWSWKFGDSGTSSIQNPTHSYSTPGQETITLTVTDFNGKTSTATHTLTVSDYASPTASFTFAPTAPNVGSTVTFTDTSTAGSGTINRWSWSFGDGGTSTVQNPTHSYSSSGQQTVSLTITDSNGKTSTTTQTITVNSGTTSGQVELSIAVPSTATAGSAFSITVTAEDELGNTVTSYAGTVHFTSSDGQAVLPSDSTLTSGTGTFTVTLKTLGSETITATDGTVTNVSPLITVNAAAASKLTYTIGTSQSITISDISSVITVQRQDQYGNPTTTGSITVTLASTSSNGRFYSDSGGSQRITSPVTIPDGSSSYNFYYMDSNSGTPTLTASSSGLTSATTQFTINNYQLAYTGGATQNLPANQVSAAITIQSQDTSSNRHNPGSTLTVTLTSSSATGTFYSDSAGTHAITTVTITTTSPYTATFYYKDTAQGTPKITATATGYTPATTTFTITGSATQLKFTAGASQSLYVNQVSSVITVTQEDSSGLAVNAVNALTVSLTTTSSTGAFYNNAAGTGTAITSVTITSGSSSANFYYKDSAGLPTLTASSTGLTSATTTFTITPNQVPNGGFEQSTSWQSGGTGYAESHVTNDNAPALSGAYAEIDTTISGTGTAYASLTNTFSPGITLSSIPNTAGSLSMWIYNNEKGGVSSIAGYYSFQITLTASDGTQLIYWWGNSPATAPTQTATTKVINMGTLPGMFTVGQWIHFSRNLPADWATAGLSSSASITSIILQGNAYVSGGHQYGQEIFIDNVQIQ
jgi:PKD repeat protein